MMYKLLASLVAVLLLAVCTDPDAIAMQKDDGTFVPDPGVASDESILDHYNRLGGVGVFGTIDAADSFQTGYVGATTYTAPYRNTSRGYRIYLHPVYGCAYWTHGDIRAKYQARGSGSQRDCEGLLGFLISLTIQTITSASPISKKEEKVTAICVRLLWA